MSAVLYEQHGGVALITLNRPDRLNAINHDLINGLDEALTTVAKDPSVRAVVLAGKGRGFSAGADLELFGSVKDPADVRDYILKFYQNLIRKITTLHKPVIGAINGMAAGVGMSFALATDLRVMADDAYLMMAFINIGLGPDGGVSWLLVRQVGYSRAFEMAVEGRKIPASECLSLGLANRVVPAGQVLEESMAWAEKLANQPTMAVGITKWDLHFASSASLMDTIAFEAEQQMAAFASTDHKEGVQAFLEKRPPKFVGK